MSCADKMLSTLGYYSSSIEAEHPGPHFNPMATPSWTQDELDALWSMPPGSSNDPEDVQLPTLAASPTLATPLQTTALPLTVSPADLVREISSTSLTSTAYTNLTSPSRDGSPNYAGSSKPSPITKAAVSSSRSGHVVQENWFPLFPNHSPTLLPAIAEDAAESNGGLAEASMATGLVLDTVDLAAAPVGAVEESPLLLPCSLPTATTTIITNPTNPSITNSHTLGSPRRSASTLINAGSVQPSPVAGVNPRKRDRTLPPVTIADPADPVAVKRARNTLAARKSRQKKVEHVDELERTIKELTAERDYWKGLAQANGLA